MLGINTLCHSPSPYTSVDPDAQQGGVLPTIPTQPKRIEERLEETRDRLALLATNMLSQSHLLQEVGMMVGESSLGILRTIADTPADNLHRPVQEAMLKLLHDTVTRRITQLKNGDDPLINAARDAAGEFSNAFYWAKRGDRTRTESFFMLARSHAEKLIARGELILGS